MSKTFRLTSAARGAMESAGGVEVDLLDLSRPQVRVGMTSEADKRALLDLQINLFAEQESTKALTLLQRIGMHLGWR